MPRARTLSVTAVTGLAVAVLFAFTFVGLAAEVLAALGLVGLLLRAVCSLVAAMRKRRVSVGGCILAALAASSYVRAEAAAPSPCSLKRSITLARDSRGRVLERTYGVGDPYPTTRIYGCLYRENQLVLLAHSEGSGLSAAWVTIKSPWVGFVERDEYEGVASDTPTVFNLSTRTSRSFHARDVSDFAMTRTGHFAWIDRMPSSAYHPNDPPAVRHDRPRSARSPGFGALLDTGDGIDPTSLRVLSRTSVAWTHGGRTRSARLR